jgi:hypothetical protein
MRSSNPQECEDRGGYSPLADWIVDAIRPLRSELVNVSTSDMAISKAAACGLDADSI